MQNSIDLSPLFAHRAATEMLLLARGQLNQAFCTHGLRSPDPLRIRNPSCTDEADLDAPAACGSEQARALFGEAFDIWSQEMPRDLAHPVLDILWQTLQALRQQNGASEASAAVLQAHEFLLGQVTETVLVMPGSGTNRARGSRADPGRCGLGSSEVQL